MGTVPRGRNPYYCGFAPKWRVIFKSISTPPFFSKMRTFFKNRLRVSRYGGLYGQNLPYKFKKSYGDFQNRDFEKSHRTTGFRSDLSNF
jgi:hypothetical protein